MSGWVRAVHDAGIPSASELTSAINAGVATDLQQLSNRFIAAGRKLNAARDPKGQRVISTTLRLGLLIYAESARVAQAATMVSDPTQAGRLTDVARRLALIGDTFWNPALGARHSGFNLDLLAQTGP
jgi:hypothetical protein